MIDLLVAALVGGIVGILIVEIKSWKEQMKKFICLMLVSVSSVALAAAPEKIPNSNLIVIDEELLPALPEAESIQKLKDGTIRLHRFEREVPLVPSINRTEVV